MCGIAGIVNFDRLPPEERDLGGRMARTLHHRGPDELGAYVDRRASLGHARLSIIDIEAGQQPMSNEDGTCWVVFNGEIYNHRAIARELTARGHRLRTRCDTEVLVHLYEEHGPSFVDQLNGMFALAVWDARRGRLMIARDRLGIKPLYWYADGRRVLFGSELKALLVDSAIPRTLDPRALTDYLTFGHVPAPRTIWKDIAKLEPGCMVIADASTVRVHRYWDVPFEGEAAGNSADWSDAFAAALQDAVSQRFVADVPVGAFLSGGVDSTAVATAMRRGTDAHVMTHTVGFDEPGFDERDAARETAGRLGTDHREFVVHADAVAASQLLARRFDEPFADPAAIPNYYLAQTTRQRVIVALSGDGADETLAGYRRYRFDLAGARWRRLAPPWLRRSTFGAAGWIYPKADWLPRTLRAKATLQNLALDEITAHLHGVALYGGELPARLLRPEYVDKRYDPFDRGRDLFARCPSPDLLNRLLYVDTKTLLADEILTKVDRTSMAVGLEVRVPLLDHRLVELAAAMPTSLKLGEGQGKRLLRDTLKRWAPDVASTRPKHGFDVPVDRWFRSSLAGPARDLLLGRDARSRAWLEPKVVERLLAEHARGVRHHGHVLWVLWSLEQWARASTDGITEPQGRWVTQYNSGALTTCAS